MALPLMPIQKQPTKTNFGFVSHVSTEASVNRE
jgi:hypothetical protein